MKMGYLRQLLKKDPIINLAAPQMIQQEKVTSQNDNRDNRIIEKENEIQKAQIDIDQYILASQIDSNNYQSYFTSINFNSVWKEIQIDDEIILLNHMNNGIFMNFEIIFLQISIYISIFQVFQKFYKNIQLLNQIKIYMKSANKSISDIFFMNQRTPLSEIKNQSMYLDCYEEQQQQIQVLEKKLLEQQQINLKQTEEIDSLKCDVKSAKQLIDQTQNQLDQFYEEMKKKEEQLFNFEKQIREKEMELINKELSLVNRQTQTEETQIQLISESNEQESSIDIDIARVLFEKRIHKEYKILQEKQHELQARENAIIFRENKIKEFMNKLSSAM
ncbi:unnamed protein product [Paramecium sonneborni]|uniref:Transmembrane protein n=1 Tax=Paramecium sonneborni TaxID=65129 RepID=A0A8S1L0V8_9CILI|nr:unnamed protein product [Paramecium sonneborni]